MNDMATTFTLDSGAMATARPAIIRSATFTARAAADGTEGDGLTLEGHAAVFGQQTEIDSWEGTFTEECMPGMFRKSIRERMPVMQFDHGRHPLVGSIPIGAFDTLEEDKDGLFVRARMLDNWLIQPVREAIANGTINGMSFRFEVIRDRWFDNKGKRLTDPNEIANLLWAPGDRGPLRRELVEVRVPELGPVVFPAYEGTDVSVRAARTASEIVHDPALARKVREMLVTGVNHVPTFSAAEIARAILFDLPVREGDEGDEDNETAESETATLEDNSGEANPEDAAPRDAHPAENDAPPNEAPVTTPTDKASREQYVRRAYVALNGVGK
jgi:HK97 family phage prohead protease